MCQTSIYVKEGKEERLFQEDITKLEILENGIRISSLFEAPAELDDVIIRQIDFTAGKVLVEKQSR